MIVCISAFLMTPFLLFSQVPTEEEILTSIDLGVEWMVNQQNTDGSWEEWESVAHTGFALTKLCDYAYEQSPPLSPFDEEYIYSTNVIAGFSFLFSHARTYGTELGIYVLEDMSDRHHETYNTAIALMALASSYMPTKIINSENNLVNGLTFAQLVDQIVIYFEWSQNDYNPPNFHGGWGYHENCWPSDNSHTGYVVLALSYAETFGTDIPQVIKDKLTLWIDYIQNNDTEHPDNLYGGSGYSDPENWVTSLKTGNLLFEMAFCGDLLEDTRVQNALGFLAAHWDDVSTPCTSNVEHDYGWQEHLQAMFCLMKGFESFSMDFIEVNSDDRNWFEEFTTYIVGAQKTDGSWLADQCSYWGWNDLLNTFWALFVLEKVTSIPAPVVFVDFDIHPTSWPNPINTNSRGLVPTAILGTENFDVTTVDPESLLLEGVSPITWSIEDVTGPAEGEGDCNDTEEGPDGYADLTLKYDTKELVTALGEVNNGDEMILTITGNLLDGTQVVKANDCIIIKANKSFEIELDNPFNYNLEQNYPNPFSSTTSIRFKLPKNSHVLLKVFDIMGNERITLANKEYSTGYHLVEFDASNLANGIYFYRLYTTDYTDTKQMLLIE